MAMMTVTLYADTQLKDNVKYRSGGLANSAVIATVEAVSNGNLTNKNIYDDNSVEISTPIDTCARANYVALTIENTVIAGEIIGLNYINDTNTQIVYTVDYYTTAQMTQAKRPGFFTGAFGLCRRTNLTYPKESVVNQQSEPYGGGDIKILDPKLTEMFNTEVETYTGISIAGGTSLHDMGYRYVLWISAFAADAIKDAGGQAAKFAQNPNPPTENTVTLVTEFGGTNEANVNWQQSFATGLPLVFNDTTVMTDYINQMLSNVGQYIMIDPSGIEDDGIMARYVNVDKQYFFVEQEMTEDQATETENVPMKQVRMITDIDIFRIQIIPEKFCDGSTDDIYTGTINTGYGLHNFNPLRDERDTILPDGTIVQDFSKSKLMTYPYWYHQMVTRIGNVSDLLPQNQMKIVNYLNDADYKIKLRFVGGNMPKLLICIQNKEDFNGGVFDKTNESNWFTIYEYPTIAWANGVSSQQQMGELSARIHRQSQKQQAVIGASTKGTGFMYGFRGGQTHSGQGWFRKAMTNFGGWVGSFATDESQPYNSNENVGAVKRSEQAELDSQTAMDNSGRVVTSDPVTILGEGSIEMLYSQPITIYRCGMTDGELYGFARFIERKGQTCHLNINPISNAGDVFSGNASITSYGGKTYYEFFDLDVNGTMPIQYKNAIQMMFCGGCYLIS